MGQPIWVTNAGSLGSIPEQVFYQVPLIAYDPDAPLADNVLFRLLAGSLPAGVQITDNGLISGVPQAIASVQGIPENVGADITSKFTVRAYTEITVNGQLVVDRFRDRTFELTVVGQNVPNFVTAAGEILSANAGTQISFQLEFTDGDLGDLVVVQLAAGQLPPGLTLSATGLISGTLFLIPPIDAVPGYSRNGQGFDGYPFDFSATSVSTNFEFTVEITDGKSSNLRTFSILVLEDANPPPVLLNAEPGIVNQLGTYRNDNFFAYRFIGYDFDDDQMVYLTANDSSGDQLPPGLQLDPETGWLYGYIPNLGITELEYNFVIRVAKAGDLSIISDGYQFRIQVVGSVDLDVVWISPANLGVINNGDVSVFHVEARNIGGKTLQYRLKPGGYPITESVVYNKLPQGLTLLPSGNIAGRVSFNTFALDGGTTTFDTEMTTRLASDPTTFDLKFTFTVEAYSGDNLISVFKTFTITVNREYNEPYNNLYIKAMPPVADRAIIDQLLDNSDIFKPAFLYRPDDPNFGVASSVVYYHAYGLTAATYQDYVNSLDINHYRKSLVLGPVTTARALDDTGAVLYDVVYSPIIDNLVNNLGQSVSKQVTLPYPVTFYQDSTLIETVYPNSLINMRDQVIDTVGKISEVLPRWMLTKQENGRILGFTPAWVLCYAKPGRGKQIAYNINQQFGQQLNIIDFDVDRYELDRLLSIHWDSETQQWVPEPAETTFDLDCHYQVTAFNPGVSYQIDDELTILGSNVGGQDGSNNIVIRVADVDQYGGITEFFVIQSVAPLLSQGDTYLAVGQNSTTGSGAGATFNFEVGCGNITTFDATSLRFEAPVDNYSNTDAFDKYLVFPRRNILV